MCNWKHKITIFGGNQWRPFIHVEDVSQALVNCIETPFSKIKGQIFNLGANEENYLISDLGEIIKKLIPDTKVDMIENNSDKRTYNVKFDKIKKTFNFKPSRTVEIGIQEIYQALEKGKFRNPKDSKYYNYHPES